MLAETVEEMDAFLRGAEVLVTGDRDLLDIAAEASIAILSPRGFWERLRARPDRGESKG